MQLHDELFGTPERLVMDPVHGGIPFFEHEKTVIDHPLFQRLRYIIQNDVTSLVFPGTTHTRFQHSLGTMHIAGRLIKSMVRAYLSESAARRSNLLSPTQAEAIRYFYFCVRLAALLHDAGHFPFSHQLEASSEFKGLLQDHDLFTSLWPRDSWKICYNRIPASVSHEHYSVCVAHRIMSDQQKDLPVEIVDVLSLMETTESEPSSTFKAYTRDNLLKVTDVTIKNFFKTLISGELDTDKMDYLLRDPFFSGCKYGIYNLDHLLSTIRIGVNPPGQLPWVGVAITEKGLGPLEDFVYARFQLYQELYSHKTVVGFKWLITKALDDLLRSDEHRRPTRKGLRDMDSFAHFTDMFFWERLRSMALMVPGCAADFLLRRQKLKHLATAKDLDELAKDATTTKLSRGRSRRVISYESPIKFSKLGKPSEQIRLLKRDPFTGTRALEPINQHTNFFEKFRDTVITHFYEEPTLQELRSRVLKQKHSQKTLANKRMERTPKTRRSS